MSRKVLVVDDEKLIVKGIRFSLEQDGMEAVSYTHLLLGGLAIRDINADEAQTLGYFSPKQHDNGSYLIQSS